MLSVQQLTLDARGHDTPAVDARFRERRRVRLKRGAWIDHIPGWLRGHMSVFDTLYRSTRWQASRTVMWEREVDTPRLTASLPEHGPGHPVLHTIASALTRRYGEPLQRVSMALYRDGRDSVAWHGDTQLDSAAGLRDQPEALVATVSVGEPRRFVLRPLEAGASTVLSLGWGDLLVMGGSCQRTHQHCVPKVARALPRITIMFRA